MGQVFGADTVMGAEQPCLEIGEGLMDPGQLLGGVFRIADHGRPVLVAPGQGPIGLPSIGQDALPGVIVASAKRAKVAAERSGTTASLIRPEPEPRTSTAPARITSCCRAAGHRAALPQFHRCKSVQLHRTASRPRSGRTMARRNFCSMAQAVSIRANPS